VRRTGKVPVPDREVDGRGWSTISNHSRLKYIPATGRIFQLPLSNRSRSTRSSAMRRARYPGSLLVSAGLSSSLAGMNVTDVGPRQGIALEILGGVGPYEFVAGLDEPAEFAGSVGDRVASLLIDPPLDKLATHESASGLVVAMMRGLTPQVLRLRLSM